MPRGAHLLLISGCLVATGCATKHELQVRPLGETHVKSQSGGGLLAEARGQLALGNVGLALESFRSVQRQQPDGADAYEGIADCYAAMGRYDLARANYEFALAYAPNNPKLLHELAGSLDQLGEREQAVGVRAEAARLSVRQAEAVGLQQAAITPVGVPRAASITVKLPEAHPLRAPEKTLARKPTQPTPAVAVASVIATQARPVGAAPTPAPERIDAVVALKARAIAVAVSPTAAISVAPPHVPVAAINSTPEPAPARAAVHKQLALGAPRERDSVPAQQGPRLERESRGEVMLITTPGRMQLAQVDRPPMPHAEARAPAPPTQRPVAPSRHVAVALAETQVQWVPLKGTEPRYVQLLNAARTQGLAARTRIALADRGWRRLAIGNARKVRQHSLVLYGAARLHVAARLAAQFGCNAVKVAGMKSVVVLLGRDAVGRKSPSYRA